MLLIPGVAAAPVVQVMVVPAVTETPVAATPPIVTATAPPKLAPAMVSDVPPDCGPLSGEQDVMVADGLYVKLPVAVALPFVAELTATSTVPGVPAGVAQVM